MVLVAGVVVVVVVGAGRMPLESRKALEFMIWAVEQTVQVGLLQLTDSVSSVPRWQ